MNINKRTYLNVKGTVLNDSAFLVLNQTDGAKCYWLNASGAREVALPELSGLPVFAVAGADTTYYYFLRESKKQVLINALIVKGNWRTFSKNNIELETRVYGSFVENGHLFLLTAEKSGFSLRLLEYDGLRLVKNTRFPLPIDLGRFKKASVSFYDAAATVMPSMVTSPIKIVKDKSQLWICVDEVRPENPDQTPVIIRTILIKLDLHTGQTSNKIFPEESYNFFNSIVYKGHLYRIVQDNGYHLDVFDGDTGKKIGSHSKAIEKKDNQTVNWVVRDGSKRSVEKVATQWFTIRAANRALLIVDSLDNGGILASIGERIERYSRVPSILPLGLAGVLVPLIATTLIREIGDGPEILEYVHFQIKDGKQEFFNGIVTTRQRIDDYEVPLTPAFKGYLHAPSHSFGVYIDAKTTQLRVVLFE